MDRHKSVCAMAAAMTQRSGTTSNHLEVRSTAAHRYKKPMTNFCIASPQGLLYVGVAGDVLDIEDEFSNKKENCCLCLSDLKTATLWRLPARGLLPEKNYEMAALQQVPEVEDAAVRTLSQNL
jgi:hypothetical protein